MKKLSFSLSMNIVTMITTFFLLLSVNYSIKTSILYAIIPCVNLYFLFKYTLGVGVFIIFFSFMLYSYITSLSILRWIDLRINISMIISTLLYIFIYITAIISAILIIII